ncbi:hypothetical protein [Streptomyces gilvus]|uniref:hypothetical protein n=1 Tax=Streptomyces gilvus TaxID=2920937 RepID=UPI001F0EF150|nr:hypothetical protein [Streptomyces sp. CME 23]MCH5673934.1 hypothetical protein [Streptomyces sp. CME 23]
MKHARSTTSVTTPFAAAVRKAVADVLLGGFFVAGLAASTAAGSVLDGTAKNAASGAGAVVALIAGSRIAKKPRIKAFLGRPGTLWFLFLFNGATAVAMYLTMDGVKGVVGACAMGLVSLGAAGGLVTGRRARAQARAARQTAAGAPWA